MGFNGKRVVAAGMALGTLFSVVEGTSAQDKPRTTINVVKYGGEDKEYNQFLTILKQRAMKLVETYGQKEGYDYLRDLYIERTGSPNDFEAFWRDNNSLQVLNSSTKRVNNRLAVSSDIYLFALRGKLPQNSIVLEQMLSTDDFKLTRDTYTMITLYALAMDAKRMNRPSNVIASYLRDAEEIAQDIPKKAMKGDLSLLIKAIRAEAHALKKGAGK